MMPIISEANQHQKKNQKQILLFLASVSLLCNFINCLDSTFQANEKLKRAQRDLNVANEQLSMRPYKPLI
jgi:hypothetical protein